MKKLLPAVIAALTLAVAGGASAQAQETGSVTVVHGVPGLTVDVYVNGEPTLRDFAPGTVTDALELPAGSYELAVREAGAAADSEAAISGSADLEAGANVSIVAHLDADGGPTLSVFANDTSQIAAGESRVSVRHTAAAPTVDVLANGEPLIQGLSNPDEQTANVPAGSYSVAVAPAGETDPVLGPADLAVEEGSAYAVYAFGSLEDETLDLIVQPIAAAAPGNPSGVAAGTSGLVSDALPLWVAVLLAAGAATLAASTLVLVRTTR
jgi:hypothetical protein